MAITRRQFLKRTGLATAASVVGPSLFRNPLLRNALAATDNYLVVIMMDGGNDGLNTITPYDNGFVGAGGLRDLYQTARTTGAGGIQLLSNQLLVPSNPAPPMLDTNTGSQLGFHPGLQGFKDLYDQGHLAVILGCGYPQANLSHDESGRKWETGDPLGVLSSGNGWVGRYLADNFDSHQTPGVNLRGRVAPEFLQETTGVLALQRVTDFSFPFGQGMSPAEQARFATSFESIYTDAMNASLLPFNYTGSTGFLAEQATQSFADLDLEYTTARPTFNTAYTTLGTQTANNLREIAKVIFGVANDAHPGIVTARFFETALGSFDTHSNQGGATAGQRQFQLFQELSQAVKLFYEDVSDMQAGLGDKITILLWSEFSRRITQNESGTDHGTQGPMFLIGGKVNGGVVGNHPNIATAALDTDGNTIYSQAAGDGFRSTDLRDVYGTVLRHALGVTDPSQFLPLDPNDVDHDPNLYWTVSDFDLPLFLP